MVQLEVCFLSWPSCLLSIAISISRVLNGFRHNLQEVIIANNILNDYSLGKIGSTMWQNIQIDVSCWRDVKRVLHKFHSTWFACHENASIKRMSNAVVVASCTVTLVACTHITFISDNICIHHKDFKNLNIYLLTTWIRTDVRAYLMGWCANEHPQNDASAHSVLKECHAKWEIRYLASKLSCDAMVTTIKNI